MPADRNGPASMLRGLWEMLHRLVMNAWPIICSEGVSKLFNLLLIAVIARQLGADGVGMLAVCENLLLYGIVTADMGAKLIGIRLTAQSPAHVRQIVPLVQRKRWILALVAFGAIAAWTVGTFRGRGDLWPPLIFGLAVIPYAQSIDWAPWGRQQYGWLGGWRAFVAGTYVVVAVGLLVWVHGGMRHVAVSRVASYLAGIGLLAIWRRRHLRSDSESLATDPGIDATELGWRNVLLLGCAAVANQVFQTIDVLLLAAYGTTRDVGVYAAAYKILFMLFSIFYLATQTFLPTFSRLASEAPTHALRNALLRAVVLALGAGAVCVLAVELSSREVILFLYGNALTPAIGILRLLAAAIPLEFLAAILGTYIVACGSYKASLLTLGVAAVTNVALNSVAIPRYGPHGAAVTTIVSYLVLIIVQSGVVRSYYKVRVHASAQPV